MNSVPSDSPGPPVRGQNPKVSRETRSPRPPTPAGPRRALTQLPAAHVIELCAEEQGGNDVNDREDDPECCVPFAEDLLGPPKAGLRRKLLSRPALPLGEPALSPPGWEGTLRKEQGSLLQGWTGVCAHVCTFPTGEQSTPGPHHAQHREENDDGQAGIGAVGTGVDVWVPLLVQLQHAEPRDHVHE